MLPDIVFQCGCKMPGGVLTTLGCALGDYAGNQGDPSPGSQGVPTDFYYGGNGTGIIIASRPICRLGMPTDWLDRIRVADITDGLSNTLLAGESHLPWDKLGEFPDDGPLYNGEHFTGYTRIGGPGLPITRGSRDAVASRYSFGSWHPAACNFVLADGSVRGLVPALSTSTLAALANRSDGQVVTLAP